MNTLHTASTLSRRGLLKAGGALIIGFSLTRGAVAQFGPPQGPDLEQIDSWIAVHADNTATLFIGYVELGQGCTTSLPQVAAEELDLSLEQVRIVPHETEVTPNQGGTYSSSAIARGRLQVQAAAAEARLELLKRAARRLKAPLETLRVARGIVSVAGAPEKSVSYGGLIGDKRFEVAFTGEAKPKSPSSYTIIGKRAPRRDIASKVAGTHAYIQHLRLPGMLHGRIIRPRGQRAYGAAAKLVSADKTSIAGIKDVRLLRQGDFLVVAAAREWDAVRAAEQLKVTWEEPKSLPGNENLYARMRASATKDKVIAARGDTDAAFKSAVRTSQFVAETPYQAHAPMAPNCAVADVDSKGVRVYAASQDIYTLRLTLSRIFEEPLERVSVQYQESSGTYGHSLYDDAAIAAALASRLAGAPVRVQYGREDEHGWDTFGPAHIGEVRIGADKAGTLVAYEYAGWQHSWSGVETNDQLARGTPAGVWPMGPSRSVNPAVCGGMYAIANLRLIDHELPGEAWLRGAWLRSPLDLSFAFTSEQAIDDLARQFGADPVAFRRRNIADARWRGVLNAVAKASKWRPAPPAARLSKAKVAKGRGVGLGTHLSGWGAAAAELEVDKARGIVRITRLWGAIDAGCAVNPAIVEAQIMGQLVQTVSRMLYEEVTFDETAVTSLDWASYPIARFEDYPEITPIVVQHLDQPSSGAGEEVMAATAAAIANAFFDATGVRMRTFPFTPSRVLEALKP